MDEETLGAWVAAARNSKGWTQERLGDEMGLTKANISHWETNKHEPGFWQLLRIRDLTGYPLRDVGPAANWPLPKVPRERFTSLLPSQLEALQAGVLGILAAIEAAGLGLAWDGIERRRPFVDVNNPARKHGS